MAPIRSRDLTYLRAYVQERSRQPFAYRDWPWGVIGPLGFIGILAGCGFLAEEIPFWMVLLLFPVAIGIFASTAAKISWALRQPRNESEAKELRASVRAKDVMRAIYSHQVNPLAARVLEACAFHRARVMKATEATGWEAGHMASVRQQALQAANDSMDDAIAICTGFMGPGHGRGTAWKDLAQDVAEGQLGGVVKRLQIMLDSGRDGEIVDRKDLPTELWPAYDIAVKLQRLADELEAASRRAAQPSEVPGNSLDVVLSQLTEIKRAEQELDQVQRLNQ